MRIIASVMAAAGMVLWTAAAGQVFGASSDPLQELLRVDNMEIGVTTGFYIHRVEEGTDVKRFSARPTVGYFLADRWELSVGYDYEEVKRDRDVWRTHVMLIGPVYYAPLADRTLGYFQGGLGASQSTPPAGSAAGTDQGLVLDLGMGAKIFLWRETALDLGIRWMVINEANDRDRVDLFVGTSFFLR